ncbi:MKI67 FHA domain-interacting nucleolar phosphoprotein-like [Phlebotomus argentipes]|uniref:MKI67 FHA domain-interacting nucleolar phosphoprotein-like n=1 Tax=Phlebotomus argentipes TaxID=94469 RepID=UPI0028934CB7|nr:MKI67 FHA domain-interacting nucleolar phosphoprotein-like [Phlebotomus argentipes]
MIAKIKKNTTVKVKKSKTLEKTVPKKKDAVEKKPKVKKEPQAPPKKLKGISKRFNVEKPVKKSKIKAEVKTEKTEENVTETAAAEKLTKVSGRRAKPYNCGVVQIRSLPHGFFEEQLKAFFEQFGVVNRVRVARSLKTGKSTGVGYVEFRVAEVAEIAADTMNNYLLMKSILKTKYIPPEKVTPRLMHSRVKVKMQNGKEVVLSSTNARRKGAIQSHNSKPTPKRIERRQERLKKKVQGKKHQLSEAGIDFDVESVVKKPKMKAKENPETHEKTEKTEKKPKETKKVEKDKAEKSPVKPAKAKTAKKAVVSKKVKEEKKAKESPKKSAVKKKKISIKLAPIKPKKVDSPKKDAKKGLKIKVGQKMAGKKSKKIV